MAIFNTYGRWCGDAIYALYWIYSTWGWAYGGVTAYGVWWRPLMVSPTGYSWVCGATSGLTAYGRSGCLVLQGALCFLAAACAVVHTFLVFLYGHATGAVWLHFLMLDCLHRDLPITYMMKSVFLVYHHINGLQGQVWGFGHCGAVYVREPAVHRRRAPERAPGAGLISDSGEKAPRGHGSSLKVIDCSERDRRDSERLCL